MQPTVRQQKTLEILEQRGSVSVAELAGVFAVSDNTIRNDLDTLAEQGLVERTHGGATLPSFLLPSQLRPKAPRLSSKARHIVEYAAGWVEESDSLILGNSPLCVMLAEKIAHMKFLRVITASMPVAYILSQEPSNTVVLAGGELDRAVLATQGSMVEATIRNFRADKAFFSCTGVSAENGLTDASTETAEVKHQMKNGAQLVFIVVESDRVGKIDLFPIGELSEAHRIVTDDGLASEDAIALAENGMAKVTVCWDGGHKTHRPRVGPDRKLRIGFANLSDKIWFSQIVRQGLEAAAQQTPEVELLVADNQNSLETAVKNAEWFLQHDIDLLIEYDGTGRATRPIRRMMHQAEIPVIAVDIPMIAAIHFGCDHEAAGVTAGHALGQWITAHWGGQVDRLLMLNNKGGGTMNEDGNVQLQNWTGEGYLGTTLTPATRFHTTLEALHDALPALPEVQKLTLPGDWVTSAEGVAYEEPLLDKVLAGISEGQRVVAVCLVNEVAISLAQAVRRVGRSEQFVVISFGSPSLAVRTELSRPDTCLMGIVNLHPERYGEGLLRTALRLFNGDAVPPAVFVEHSFLAQEAVQMK